MVVSPDARCRLVACLGAKAKPPAPAPSNIHFFISNILHISLGRPGTPAILRRRRDFLRVIPVPIIESLTDYL